MDAYSAVPLYAPRKWDGTRDLQSPHPWGTEPQSEATREEPKLLREALGNIIISTIDPVLIPSERLWGPSIKRCGRSCTLRQLGPPTTEQTPSRSWLSLSTNGLVAWFIQSIKRTGSLILIRRRSEYAYTFLIIYLSANMPPFKLPKHAFPPLNLSADEQQHMTQYASWVVEETMAVNRTFRAGARQVDSKHWRLVRSKEGIRVFKERGPRANAKQRRSLAEEIASSSSSSTSGCGDEPIDQSAASSAESSASAPVTTYVESLRRPGIPMMVASGMVDGTLDDCMLGCFADSDASWLWRSAHLNDKLEDAKILTKIHGPSAEDPYRFLGVKWFTREHSAVVSKVAHRRDFLMLEATGITADPVTGERVGYFLMHSIKIPRIPKLSDMGIIRGNISICFLVRQVGDSTIELYCRGFIDAAGAMPERVSAHFCADSLIAAANVIECASIKKLTYLLKTRKLADPDPRSKADLKNCESCDRKLKNRLGMQSMLSCQVCRRAICKPCSLVKTLTVDVSNNVATQMPVWFCLKCVLEAKQLPALEIARATQTPTPATPHDQIVEERQNRSRATTTAPLVNLYEAPDPVAQAVKDGLTLEEQLELYDFTRGIPKAPVHEPVVEVSRANPRHPRNRAQQSSAHDIPVKKPHHRNSPIESAPAKHANRRSPDRTANPIGYVYPRLHSRFEEDIEEYRL